VERLTELAQMHERVALRDWVTGYANHFLSHEPVERPEARYRDLPLPIPTT
jgi:hypothetical protein